MKDYSLVLEKLNKISLDGYAIIGGVNFYGGESVSETLALLTKLTPFGKTVILINGEVSEKVANLQKTLLNARFTVELIDCADKSVKEITETMPEIARSVIALENALFDTAGEVAGALNIYCLLALDTFDFANVLNYKSLATNQVLDFDRHIILDFEKIFADEVNLANEYAFIMSKLLALIDYRILGILTKTPMNKNAYSLIRQAVEQTFTIFNYSREEYLLTILESGLTARLANLISSGKIFANSAVDIAVGLSGNVQTTIPYLKRIARIYSLTFTGEYEEVGEPNYLSIVENITQLTLETELNVTKWIIKQSQIYNERSEEVQVIKQKLFPESVGYLTVVNNVEKTYIALGGQTLAADDKIIKQAGDFCGVFNGITLARECGICEFL